MTLSKRIARPGWREIDDMMPEKFAKAVAEMMMLKVAALPGRRAEEARTGHRERDSLEPLLIAALGSDSRQPPPPTRFAISSCFYQQQQVRALTPALEAPSDRLLGCRIVSFSFPATPASEGLSPPSLDVQCQFWRSVINQ